MQQNKQQQFTQQPVQQNISPSEQFRNNLYNNKKEELNKELKKYEEYCIRSKDLEHILSLHNFFLGDSFKEVRSIYNRYMKRVENQVNDKAKEVLSDTFHLLFIEHALDFYNEFGIRVNIIVPEKHMENKEVFTVNTVSVIYKGEDKDDVVVNLTQADEVVQDINSLTSDVSDIKKELLSHSKFVEVFKNVIYNTLASPQITYNTVFFNKTDKDNTYLNAADFKKFSKKGFDKFINELSDFNINTTLTPNLDIIDSVE